MKTMAVIGQSIRCVCLGLQCDTKKWWLAGVSGVIRWERGDNGVILSRDRK